MCLFKLKTPMLAFVFSVVVEGLFVAAFLMWGDYSGVGPPRNLFNQLFEWFHIPARACCLHIFGIGTEHQVPAFYGPLFLFVAVFEWWLIFTIAIWLVRQSTKKSA
jgi:hypothetical protein